MPRIWGFWRRCSWTGLALGAAGQLVGFPLQGGCCVSFGGYGGGMEWRRRNLLSVLLPGAGDQTD